MELSPKESLPALDVVSSVECGGRIPETLKRYRGGTTRTFRFGTGDFDGWYGGVRRGRATGDWRQATGGRGLVTADRTVNAVASRQSPAACVTGG